MRLAFILSAIQGFAVPIIAGSKRPKRTDFLVHGLGEVEPSFHTFDGVMYAGLIPTHPYEPNKKSNDGELMFWLFVPETPKHDDSVVVWMNGGPGCSSMGGCLFENGPVTVALSPAGFYGIKDPPLVPNHYAWTKATVMLYVEHPHGTGFSTGPFPNNETDVSRDFYFFLQNLYNVFDELRPKRLYFFGESYAGMYVPSIAHYIHQENKRNDFGHINLAGIGLGNGWIDARVQGPAVIDYAWWHGMIDSSTRATMHQEWENCKNGAKQNAPFHAFTVPDECNIMGAVLEAAGAGLVSWGAPNTYDVTTWDLYAMLDDPHGAMAEFFNNPKVQDALHVRPHTLWLECMPGAGRRRLQQNDDMPGKNLLAQDQPISVVPYMADLLDDAGIRVLVYNGDRDMSTNAQGSEMLLDAMDWSGALGWSNPTLFERGLWLSDPEEVSGYIKSYKNLEFIIVLNSGHLVPFNRPNVALDMIDRFLGNVSYMDKPLPKFRLSVEGNASRKNDESEEDGGAGIKVTERARYNWGSYVVIGVLGFIAGLFVAYLISCMPTSRSYYEVIPANGH